MRASHSATQRARRSPSAENQFGLRTGHRLQQHARDGSRRFLGQKSLCGHQNLRSRGRGSGAHPVENKRTPGDAKVFTIEDEDLPLEMGQPLYMIGYNAGPDLAKTSTGIQAQMTSGKVTQLPDGQRVLYDIATVQGSSGSPVIDAEGNLVAVNFCQVESFRQFQFRNPSQARQRVYEEVIHAPFPRSASHHPVVFIFW